MNERTWPPGRVLLTGATGYVGGRLREALEGRGTTLRCLTRDPGRLSGRVGPATEIVRGDVRDPESLGTALAGVDTLIYLVHSMGATSDYEQADARAARNVAEAARAAGVRHIVYLGGLGEGEALSRHLESRQEVGRLLRGSPVPTTELRASIIIGSGSLSFEMIRALVDRLPVMVTPRWVDTPSQPIAIEDVVDYLLAAIDAPVDESVVHEIGGPDRVSYGDLMREYARQRGLRRLMVRVPVLTPYLSGLWLGLVTPVYARVGRELIAGLRVPTVVHDPSARAAYDVDPRGAAEAISRALINEDHEFATTRWSDALSSAGPNGRSGFGGTRVGARLIDARAAEVDAPPDRAFAPIRRIGGTTGWYYGEPLWRLRGLLDLVARGAGMRRGRRDPEHLRVGDTLDWWRVEAYEEDRLLRLAAEMRVPGRAWLEFEVRPTATGSQVLQTAEFDARGVFGRLYWYALWPLHQLIFAGMLRRIAALGEREPGSTSPRR